MYIFDVRVSINKWEINICTWSAMSLKSTGINIINGYMVWMMMVGSNGPQQRPWHYQYSSWIFSLRVTKKKTYFRNGEVTTGKGLYQPGSGIGNTFMLPLIELYRQTSLINAAMIRRWDLCFIQTPIAWLFRTRYYIFDAGFAAL